MERQQRRFIVARMRPVEHPQKVAVVVGKLHDCDDGCDMLAQFRVADILGEPAVELVFVPALVVAGHCLF